MALARSLIVMALAAAAAVGCGDDEGERAGRVPATGAPGALALTVRTEDAPGPGRYSARCESDCAATVSDWNGLVARVRTRGRVCTQIYGGPEKAHVTGRLAGERVDLRITRTDGCGIEDYKALFALLGTDPPVR